MEESSIVELIKRLRSNTKKGKVKWEETAIEGVFQTAFPDYVVQVAVRGSSYSGTDYLVRVLDRDGSLVDEVSDPQLEELWNPTGEALRTMQDLYTQARRSAKGVDKAIKDILSALDEEDDDIPF